MKTKPNKPTDTHSTLDEQLLAKKQLGLAGTFFHSLSKETGKVEWQGLVIGSPEPGWYLVQLFEWAMGEACVQRLVRFEEMKDWLFYGSQDDMIYSYDYGTARAGSQYRDHDRDPDVAEASVV